MTVLWGILIVCGLLTVFAWYVDKPRKEHFINLGGGFSGISLANLSTKALDSTPTTSELKNHYKNLLIFANDDIRKQGVQGLRILADFRDRVYGKRNFRDNLKVEDFLANWPSWLPQLDTSITEPVPESSTAVMAESSMLAYLQKNFPQEDKVDEQTGSTIRNLIEDFGYRFVFKKGKEKVALAPDFLRQPLLKDWKNPVMVP